MKRIVRSVYKNVFLSAVPVHVDEREYRVIVAIAFGLLLDFTCEALDCTHGRVKHLTRVLVLSVEVIPAKRRTVVSYYHAVRIRYRDDLDNETLSQLTSLQRIPCNVLEKALHHPRTVALSWVHPSRNNQVLFVALVSWRWKLLRELMLRDEV